MWSQLPLKQLVCVCVCVCTANTISRLYIVAQIRALVQLYRYVTIKFHEGCIYAFFKSSSSSRSVVFCSSNSQYRVFIKFLERLEVSIKRTSKRCSAHWRCLCIIGANLSKPHTSELNSEIFIYIYIHIYISVVRRSVNASSLF